MSRGLIAWAASITLWACGSGAPAPTTPTPSPPSAPTNIYSLSGTVRDDTGASLQGARVAVGGDPRHSGYGFATTDALGHYAIGGLYLGKQPVFVNKPGFVRIFQDIEITPNAVMDFTMRPGVIVSGRTLEAGVGPLNGATITVTSGPDAGVQTMTGVIGGFSLPPVLPGDFGIRAAKPGYESVDRTVHAAADVYLDDITLKWSYGSCLTSVAPIVFDRVPAAGTTATVSLQAESGHAWIAKADVPWVTVPNGSRTGSSTLQFQVQPNPIGALDIRSGAIQIRCSQNEGQNIWITQMVDCQTTVEPDSKTPRVFPADGGTGRLLVRFGVPGCRSKDYTNADWMFLVGAGSYMTQEVDFVVRSNTTGVERVGVIVVGETRWTVKQDW